MPRTGRPRKPSPAMPAHIDPAKLPRGVFWDGSRARWYVKECLSRNESIAQACIAAGIAWEG